ncbi:MAG: LuxR C-terminal-related transcriptional regulator [Bradymonadaceae bacterium]
MVEGRNQISGDELDMRDDCSESIRFLFEPSSGSIEYATRSGREWLTPERRRFIEKIVDEADGDDTTRLRRDGYQVVLHSMFGALGHRLLVTVSENDDVSEAADVLTERQLEVAEYAASGATGPEIADALDVEPSTIYDHLQKIYDRLEIGSRAELTRAVLGN